MTRLLTPGRRPTDVAGWLIGLAVLLLFAVPAMAQSKIDFPPLSGRVVDQAGLLDPATEQALTEKLQTLEAATTDQLVVVTVSSLQDQEIEDYGYQLGRAWGIGQKEKDNGAMLIVAPNERKVRVEVGYGLEPILTDAFSSQVIRNDILPSFRDGDYKTGVVKGVDALIAQLSLDPAEAQARAQAVADEQAKDKGGSIAPLVIVAIIFLFMFLAAARSGRGRRSGVGSVLLWAASEALRDSGRGGGGWG
ncbi:TPM domain-containing protein, partial [Brevundimonas sp. UBA5718]